MPIPAFFPEVDTNKTRQPADPAGIPQAIKDDGFRENEVVPNTFWNWLFSLLNDWVSFAYSSRVLDISGGASVISAGGELALCSATIPANTLVANKSTIRISGAFELTNVVAATLFTMRIRVADTSVVIASINTASLNIGDIFHMDAELTLASAGALHFVVRVTETTAAVPAVITHNIVAGVTTIDPTLAGGYRITGEWTGGVGFDIAVSRAQSVRLDQL